MIGCMMQCVISMQFAARPEHGRAAAHRAAASMHGDGALDPPEATRVTHSALTASPVVSSLFLRT